VLWPVDFACLSIVNQARDGMMLPGASSDTQLPTSLGFDLDVQINYEQLVQKFYEIHDPTTLNRQKGDAGTQYRSGIYYRSDQEKQVQHLQCWRTVHA
jgi:Peptide methionine sulfoxide reductase